VVTTRLRLGQRSLSAEQRAQRTVFANIPMVSRLGDAGAWKRRMELQNERRQDTFDLWERLDDLVTDTSEFPLDAN